MSELEHLDQSKLNELGRLVTERLATEKDIAGCEEQLALLNTAHDRNEQMICDLLMELGISQMKLTTGEKVTMSKFYSCSIIPEKLEDALRWLRDNGHGSLIKNNISGTLGMGEDAVAQEIMSWLGQKVPGAFGMKTGVHAMTLKALAKEQTEAGVQMPSECFSLFIGNKIKIR